MVVSMTDCDWATLGQAADNDIIGGRSDNMKQMACYTDSSAAPVCTSPTLNKVQLLLFCSQNYVEETSFERLC